MFGHWWFEGVDWLKLVLRGVVRSVLIAIALFFATAYALEWARFSPTSILAARVLLTLAIAGNSLALFNARCASSAPYRSPSPAKAANPVSAFSYATSAASCPRARPHAVARP